MADRSARPLSNSLFNLTVHTWCPVIAFNRAAEQASGEFFIITNPECFHSVNIFQELDKEFNKDWNEEKFYSLVGVESVSPRTYLPNDGFLVGGMVIGEMRKVFKRKGFVLN